MMTLVNLYDPGLVILPTHRLLKETEFKLPVLLSALAEDFVVDAVRESDAGHFVDLLAAKAGLEEAAVGGQRRHIFGLYAGSGRFYVLTLRDEETIRHRMPAGRSAAWCRLDVVVLQKLVLERWLGIDDRALAEAKKVEYTRDAHEAVRAVDQGKYSAAFLMNPTLVTEVIEVAARGEKMPQKSTFFYPKLITGLVINKF